MLSWAVTGVTIVLIVVMLGFSMLVSAAAGRELWARMHRAPAVGGAARKRWMRGRGTARPPLE
jgi:hypothetical protein